MYIYIKKKTCKPKKVFPTSFLLKKFIAKTVEKDPAGYKRCISRKEIQSAKVLRQKKEKSKDHCTGDNNVYKITKIVHALWLADRCVCMRVCKHGCGVEMFRCSGANHASKNLKKFLSWKLHKLKYLIYPFPPRLTLGNLYKHTVSTFSLISWHFKREKPLFWKACLHSLI